MLLQNIADKLGLRLQGTSNPEIDSLAPIKAASTGQLSFVVGPKFQQALETTGASAVILPPSMSASSPCDALLSDNPYLSYAEVSRLLYPDPKPHPGIAETATVASSASVDPSATVDHQAVVGAGAQIGAYSHVGPGCVVGERVHIGSRTVLRAHVVIEPDCVLGNNCLLQSGVVIGGDGFGYARSSEGWCRIQQVGRVVIGNRVEIGANTTIDRGALDDTVIADGVILDNQIQIAHNVHIGENTAIAACVGIAGSTRIGKNCTIGGKAAIVGHLHITDNVHLTATTFVTRSISESGSYSTGLPLQTTRRWRRDLRPVGEVGRSVENRETSK